MTLLLALALDGPDVSLVRQAERDGVHIAVFDGSGGLETASFVAAATRDIALVVAAPVTYAEPFHLANRLASLDHVSRGRAGWLATVDTSPERAAAFGRAAPFDAATAAREGAEVLDAVRRLWDSWEDGALIADEATGRFLDRDRLHYVDFAGEFFRIRGPALLPRPPRGQVVVFAPPPLAGLADVVLGRDFLDVTAVGDAGELVAYLREIDSSVDGVLLRSPEVVPALRAAGLVAPARPGGTLRDLLGLPRPVSRYAERT